MKKVAYFMRLKAFIKKQQQKTNNNIYNILYNLYNLKHFTYGLILVVLLQTQSSVIVNMLTWETCSRLHLFFSRVSNNVGSYR